MKNFNAISLATLIQQAVWFAFLSAGLLVFFYIPWSITQDIPFAAVAIIGTGFASLSIWLGLRSCRLPVHESPTRKKALQLFLGLLAAGILVRVIWLFLVPPVQLSDARDYWNAAVRLLETGTYSYGRPGRELLAWRPPGYPFLLAGVIAGLGAQPWIPAVTNIAFYLATSIVLFSISRRLSGYAGALFTVSLLTVWPSLIFITGIAFTESLSMLLLTASFVTFIEAERKGWSFAVASGVLTGMGALVRPALIALPALWIVYALMKHSGRGLSLQMTALAIVAMALTIAPWTVRNYRIFGTPVLISTNGGDVFYRANNPLASGGFVPYGAKDLDIYKGDELFWNRTGYAWGAQWIRENPAAFLKLAVKKQAILLGEDETGVYWSLARGHGVTGMFYKVLASLSNVWWLGIWVLSIIGLVRARQFFSNQPTGGLLLLMTLFLVAVHSVFESQPRYHLPFIGLLSIVASFALYPPKETQQVSVSRS